MWAQTSFGYPSYMVAQEPFGRPLVVKRGRSRIDLPRLPTNSQPTIHPPSSYPSGKLRSLPYGPPQLLPVELTHRELRERRDRHRAQRAGRARERKERARWEREDRQPVRWCPACDCRGEGCKRPGQSNTPPPHLGPSFPPRLPVGTRYQPRYTPLRPGYGWRVCPAYRPPQPLPAPSPPPPPLPVPPTPPPTPVYLPPAVILTPPGAFLAQRGAGMPSNIPRPEMLIPLYTPTSVRRYGGIRRRVSPERRGPTGWIDAGRMPWTVRRWVDEPAVQMGEPSQVSRDSPVSQASQVGHSVSVDESNQVHGSNQMCQDTHVSEPMYVAQGNQGSQPTFMSGAIPDIETHEPSRVWQNTSPSGALSESQPTHVNAPLYVSQSNQESQSASMSGAIRDTQTPEPSQPRQDPPLSGALLEPQDTLVSEPIHPRRRHRPRQNTFMSGAIPATQTGAPRQPRPHTRTSGAVPATGGTQAGADVRVGKGSRWVGWGREWGWGDRKGKRKADDWRGV